MITSKLNSVLLALSFLMPVVAYADIQVSVALAGETKVYSLSLDEAAYPKSVDFDVEGMVVRLTINNIETSEKGVSCGCTASVVTQDEETVVEETTINVAWNEPLVISGTDTGAQVTVVATP